MSAWDDLQTALTNIQSDLSSLSGHIGDMKTAFSTISSNIATDESAISALQTVTEVSSNPSSTGLHTQIQNIEAELRNYDVVTFPYES